jgi:hypothetical protein
VAEPRDTSLSAMGPTTNPTPPSTCCVLQTRFTLKSRPTSQLAVLQKLSGGLMAVLPRCPQAAGLQHPGQTFGVEGGRVQLKPLNHSKHGCRQPQLHVLHAVSCKPGCDPRMTPKLLCCNSCQLASRLSCHVAHNSIQGRPAW